MTTYLQEHGGVPLDHPRRCTAHRQDGQPCRRYAIRGGFVCRVHGGGSPQVVAKARERLLLAADRMVLELLGIAYTAESEAVKLAAVRDALDRAGVSAKQVVDVGVELKPYEQMLSDFAGVAHITRAESQARQTLFAHEGEPLEVVDAELVPEPPVSRLGVAGNDMPRPRKTDDAKNESALFSERRVLGPPVPLSYDAASAEMRASRLRATSQRRRARRRPR